jgi:hypothetical protein
MLTVLVRARNTYIRINYGLRWREVFGMPLARHSNPKLPCRLAGNVRGGAEAGQQEVDLQAVGWLEVGRREVSVHTHECTHS